LCFGASSVAVDEAIEEADQDETSLASKEVKNLCFDRFLFSSISRKHQSFV